MSSNVALLHSNNCCVLEPAICEDLDLHVVIFIIITSKPGQIKKSLTAQFRCKRDHKDKVSNAFSFLKLALRSAASSDTVMTPIEMLPERPFDTFKCVFLYYHFFVLT